MSLSFVFDIALLSFIILDKFPISSTTSVIFVCIRSVISILSWNLSNSGIHTTKNDLHNIPLNLLEINVICICHHYRASLDVWAVWLVSMRFDWPNSICHLDTPKLIDHVSGWWTSSSFRKPSRESVNLEMVKWMSTWRCEYSTYSTLIYINFVFQIFST